MREGLHDRLAELVEAAGAERVAARRVAPFTTEAAERLLEGLTGGAPAKPKAQAKAKPKAKQRRAQPPLPEPLKTPLPASVVPPGSLPPLPRPPTGGPTKDAFDAVLDEALAGDDVLSPMESVEAEIEVDFMDDFGEPTAVADLEFAGGADPLDAPPDEEYDIDVDVDDFVQLSAGADARRPGFYPEDNEPTKAISVDEVDASPPPDAELNVRSSIKKLFRKK